MEKKGQRNKKETQVGTLSLLFTRLYKSNLSSLFFLKLVLFSLSLLLSNQIKTCFLAPTSRVSQNIAYLLSYAIKVF